MVPPYREVVVITRYGAAAAGRFCVGNESREDGPRARVRGYRRRARGLSGAVTYGPHSRRFRVPFWERLDFLGVSAPTRWMADRAPSAPPSRGWKRWRRSGRAVGGGEEIRVHRVGYPARLRAGKQWEVTRSARNSREAALRGFFDAVWPREGMGGVMGERLAPPPQRPHATTTSWRTSRPRIS